MTSESDTIVTDDEAESRYQISVDGSPAGFAVYQRSGTRTVFVHTEIFPAGEGRGYGGRLARVALDAERAAGREVVPSCPFIAGYIRRHPQYLDLVAPEHRRSVETGS